jgi:hypothetical protein
MNRTKLVKTNRYPTWQSVCSCARGAFRVTRTRFIRPGMKHLDGLQKGHSTEGERAPETLETKYDAFEENHANSFDSRTSAAALCRDSRLHNVCEVKWQMHSKRQLAALAPGAGGLIADSRGRS